VQEVAARLPADITALLQEEGSQPTPAQAATAAGKALKEAAAALRSAVGAKVTLQARLDRAGQAYRSLLEDMKAVNQQIEERQAEVLQCQDTLKQSAAAVPEPQPLPDVLAILSGAGIDLTDDQKARINAALEAQPGLPDVGQQSQGAGVNMPVHPQVPPESLPAGAAADIIRGLRNDLSNTQQALVQTTQALQIARGDPSRDSQMEGPPSPQEVAANAEHQRAIISNLQAELIASRETIAQLAAATSPSHVEPASKKLKQDPNPGGDKSDAAASAGPGEGNRSRSPKNRVKPTGEEAEQKV
jgi:hypothetical protein